MCHYLKTLRFRAAFLLKVAAVAVTFALSNSAEAGGVSDRFCIQTILLDPIYGASNRLRLERVLETADPEHDLFFFDGKGVLPPAHLIRDRLVPVTEGIPPNFDSDSIITTPDGEVFGMGKDTAGRAVIFRMNREYGRFQAIRINGAHALSGVREIAWSSPLGALLLTIGGTAKRPDAGSVLVLKGNETVPLERVTQWVTHVSDFPKLNLTVLATQMTDRVFVIDGNQNLHDLVTLNLGDWRYISRTLFLADPPRILLEANEAMGPFRGLFLVQLEHTDGVWQPASTQDWTNLFGNIPGLDRNSSPRFQQAYDAERARYILHGQIYSAVGWFFRYLFMPSSGDFVGLYQVGNRRLEAINPSDPNLFQSLPLNIKTAIDMSHFSEFYGEREIEMPTSSATAILSDASVRVIDVEGKTHTLDRGRLGPTKFSPRGNQARLLERRGEILISSNGAFFLLKDRVIAGRDGCS